MAWETASLNCPFPKQDPGPYPTYRMVPWAQPSPDTEQHLDQSSHGCDQQTHIHKDHATSSTSDYEYDAATTCTLCHLLQQLHIKLVHCLLAVTFWCS